MKKILIISQPFFSEGLRNVTKEMNIATITVLSLDDPNWKSINFIQKIIFVNEFDIIHFFNGKTKLFHFLSYRFLSHTKIINHFIGTDLYRIINKNWLKKWKLRLCSKVSQTIAISTLLHKELQELKIPSKIINFINYDIKKINYLFPNKKKAIAYITSNNKFFFNYHKLYKLAIDFPDTEFTWCPYKIKKDERIPNNVKCIEHISQKFFIKELEKNKVFLRLTIHDGFPNTLLEALSIGRWVIWSFNFNYVSSYCTYSDLKNIFNFLINKTNPNIDGEDYILNNFNLNIIREQFLGLYETALKGKK